MGILYLEPREVSVVLRFKRCCRGVVAGGGGIDNRPEFVLKGGTPRREAAAGADGNGNKLEVVLQTGGPRLAVGTKGSPAFSIHVWAGCSSSPKFSSAGLFVDTEVYSGSGISIL